MVCTLGLLGCGAQKADTEATVETYESYKLQQEKTISSTLSLASTDKELEDYSQNIAYGWAIKQARTQEDNTAYPITLTDINNTEKLWEGYLIPDELDAYACSYKNTIDNVYVVEVVKPKQEYTAKIEKSIKLLRSGYIGGLSGQHTIDPNNVYTEKLGSCYILCICPNAEQVGKSISSNITNLQNTQAETTTESESK